MIAIAGSSSATGDLDGIGVTATFNSPLRITAAGAGLFIGDAANNKIRHIR